MTVTNIVPLQPDDWSTITEAMKSCRAAGMSQVPLRFKSKLPICKSHPALSFLQLSAAETSNIVGTGYKHELGIVGGRYLGVDVDVDDGEGRALVARHLGRPLGVVLGDPSHLGKLIYLAHWPEPDPAIVQAARTYFTAGLFFTRAERRLAEAKKNFAADSRDVGEAQQACTSAEKKHTEAHSHFSRLRDAWIEQHKLIKTAAAERIDANGKVVLKVEIKSFGSIIAMPPSKHPKLDDVHFRWEEEPCLYPGLLEVVPRVTREQVDALLEEVGGKSSRKVHAVNGDARPQQQHVEPAARDPEALAMLARQARKLAEVPPDTKRNIELNNIALLLGHFCPHRLDAGEIEAALLDACIQNGVYDSDGARQFTQSFNSGLKKGMSQPWPIGHRIEEDFGDLLPPPEQREKASPGIQWVTTKDADYTWDNPDWSLIEDRRGELPDFPLDVLTPQWRNWLERAAHGAGVTPAHVMVPALAVASGLIGTARRVQASGSWSSPLSLWAACVGFSGTGKTPGIDVTRRAVASIEKDQKDEIAELRRAHAERDAIARAAFAQWKAAVKEAVETGEEVPEMPPEAEIPEPFVAPKLVVADATIERLAVLLQVRPSGLTLIDDELAGLFANMARYSNGSDRAFWLKAWDGQRHSVDRQSRAPVVLDHLLVGIVGGFQPDKLNSSLAGDNDGMSARLLFSWPEEPGYRPLAGGAVEIDPMFKAALARLADLPATHRDAFEPSKVPLSSGALDAFERFRRDIADQMKGFDGREKKSLAKAPLQVLRLAGTLSFIDWAMRTGADAPTDKEPNNIESVFLPGQAEPSEIGVEFMASAVRLWRDYFWPHARAALRLIGFSERHVAARRVLRWARGNGKTEISVKDARRDALGQRLDAKETEVLLDRLATAGWLKKVTIPTAGRHAHRWTVNPQLFGQQGES